MRSLTLTRTPPHTRLRLSEVPAPTLLRSIFGVSGTPPRVSGTIPGEGHVPNEEV